MSTAEQPPGGEEYTPEQQEMIDKACEVLTPGAMELVRLYNEDGADWVLHEYADVFVAGFMVALVAAGIVDDPREQEG